VGDPQRLLLDRADQPGELGAEVVGGDGLGESIVGLVEELGIGGGDGGVQNEVEGDQAGEIEVVEAPQTPLDPSTALPVQVYLWADSPERAFVERTSAAIMVLLAFLLVMNASAVWLRSRLEKRW